MQLFKKHIHRHGFSHPKAKLLSLGALLFAFGVATSVAGTYAWYTINVKTTIQKLKVEIGVKEPYTLKLYLEQKDGTLIHDENGYTLEQMGYDPEECLHDVSGMFQDDWYKDADASTALPKFKKNYGSYAVSPMRSSIAENGYLQTVYYLEANRDCEVYLTPESKVSPNETENAKTAREKGKNFDELNTVTNAVRISFYTDDGYVIANPGLSEDTYYGGVLDMNGDGFYDHKEGKEILYGEYNPDAVSYNSNPGSQEPMDEAHRTTFNANHIAGVEQVNVNYEDEHLGIKKENSVKIDSLRYEEGDPLKDVTPICKLKEGEKKRIVISIYVEGWDRYMTNAIDYASFNVDMAFLALIKDSI